MDIGEKLFHWSWQKSKKWSRKKKSPVAVSFSDHKEPLTLIACAFFEKTIFLKEAEGVGGLIGDSLFLPKHVDLFDNPEDNYFFYKYKILYNHIADQLITKLQAHGLSREEHQKLSFEAYPKIIKTLVEEYPNLLDFVALINQTENLKKKTPDDLPLSFSYLPVNAQILNIKSHKESIISSDELEEKETYKKTKSKERVSFIEMDEEDPDCNPVSLLMEAVNTADIFSGGRKMIDGSDELDDHFQALEELDMRELTRSSVQTRSIFKADISVQIKDSRQDVEEEIESHNSYSYDEWNFSKSTYKKKWCHLEESKLHVGNLKAEDNLLEYQQMVTKYSKQIKHLKQYMRSLLLDRKPTNRQADGPEIDLDAVITKQIDMKSGFNGSDKIYVSKRKDISELSICTLIDSSLSADSYVSGRKVLDVTKESVAIIQEVIDEIFTDTMVASFYSNTRKKSNYHLIKDFNESWSSSSKYLTEIKASGYTRIGTALRHSLFKLEKVPAKRKVIILFSDGKPTDYDAYEGEYGIADVRQCVKEGKVQGVDIISIAIDKEAKFYFPKLFGAQNYEILEKPEDISEKLIILLSRLVK
jgi:nitric oxide reductase NorD protein